MFRHALAAILLLSTTSAAQNQPTKAPTGSQPPSRISKPPRKPGDPAPATPGAPAAAPNPTPKTPLESVTLSAGAVEMSTELFRLDTVGLSMNLPIGTTAQVTAAGNTGSATITPKGATESSVDAAWLINIQTPRSRDKSQTPETVARRVMEQLQASVGVVEPGPPDRQGNLVQKLVSTRATIVEPIKGVIVKAERPEFERPAARFYIKLPHADKPTHMIRGYTVFQSAPGEFITFELAAPEPNFNSARLIYEAAIATARFTDASALAAQRGAAIDSGVNFFAKLATPDYDAAIGLLNDKWYRLAKPAAGGADNDAEEIAYRRIRAKRGARGEIDPTARPEKWGVTEREQGIIVRFDARYLQEGKIVDIVGIYWMSADAQSEAWSLQQAIRDPQRRTPAVVTETGARDGDQMSVALSGSGEENRRIKPEVPKMGYITQVQSFLLPTLLARSQTQGGYGFYVYQSQNDRLPITMRRDFLAPSSDGSTNWVLTTQQSEDRPAQVSTFNEKSELLQTVFSSQKTVWTPTTLQRLAEIWQAKGLPMN